MVLFISVARTYNPSMLKRFVHWLVFFALVAHLIACLFLGQSYMPEAF